jgi:hypothetical protein
VELQPHLEHAGAGSAEGEDARPSAGGGKGGWFEDCAWAGRLHEDDAERSRAATRPTSPHKLPLKHFLTIGAERDLVGHGKGKGGTGKQLP